MRERSATEKDDETVYREILDAYEAMGQREWAKAQAHTNMAIVVCLRRIAFPPKDQTVVEMEERIAENLRKIGLLPKDEGDEAVPV